MKSAAIRTRGVLVLLSLLFTAGMPAARARELNFDDRVAAQKAIEQVYWNHRIWPKENPGLKPPLSKVMPEAAIREKVENYLRMSALLESYWRQPVTADQLQAELSRMTRETKAPGTLRELFAALHDDPVLIAECLARPTLAHRRVEAAFAGDTRIHGARRAELASKLAGVENLASFDRVSGNHAEIKYVLDADDTARRRFDLDPADRAIHLSRTEWNREIARLAEGLGAKTLDGPSALPVGHVSRIVDRGDRFVAFAVRAKDAASVTVASVSTPKRSYGDWARETTIAPALGARALVPVSAGYQLPALPLGGCTNDTWAATDPGQNVPSARNFHTAVWTGSEMIVWGGGAGVGTGGAYNSGGRYDPATNSWAMSSLTSGTGENVPEPRTYHAAVWTGSEVIVWGGYNGTYLNTGGRYNPAADTWAASSLTDGSAANTPDPRRFPTAVWTGSEMIVWGGYNGAHLNTGGRYDPATDTWAASSLTTGAGANVPSGRRFASAVWTGSEMIVWGGYDADAEAVFNTGGRYDPLTDSWAESSLTTGSGANAPGPQYLHTAVWTGTEMIVWGGLDSTFNNIATGGRYNPATDSWAASSLTTGSGPNVPSGRNFHTAIWTGTEMIVWGGNDANSDDLQTGGRYNPATDAWSASSLNAGTGANTPGPRSGHTAVWTGTEMIVWGGKQFFPVNLDFDTGGRYDPATDSWIATESGSGPPEARYGHTAVWTGAEMIVWGAGSSNDFFDNGGRYDPATNSWAATSLSARTGANVPDGRRGHTAVWTGAEMIVWGGYGNPDSNTGGRYNPAADSWSESSLTSGAGANVPSARTRHTAVWTGSEMIVWGGVHGTTSLNTGGRFDPSTDSWTESSLSTASGSNVPDSRFLHTAVWTGSEMIIWGGYNFDEFLDRNTGGRYSPSTDSWAASSLTTGSGPNVPTARDSHTAVWTGSEMIVWAGFGDVEIFNTGGRYNPSTDSWAASSLTTGSGPNVPSPRYGHTAVWTGPEMIVWGGQFLNFDNVSDYLGDGGRYNVITDTWAASSLTQGSGANTPGERTAHTVAWTGSEMIVWGGYDGEIALNSGGRFCATTVGGCTTDEQCDDGNACTIDACADGVCGCPASLVACTGALRNFVSTDVPKVISAEGTPTVTSSLTVSGAGPYLSDVNVRTFIAHASSGQLQITLQSPAGTIVTLSSNNGGTNAGVFIQARWDDDADPVNPAPYASPSANSNLVTDTEYPNLAVLPTFVPEEALGAFIGENPNGVWTLTVADQTDLDGGTVENWSLDLSTLATPPPSVTLSYASSDVPKPISSSGTPTVISTVAVSGAGTQIGQVRLQSFIQHSFSSDLDVTITSPGGTSVTLTTDNGGAFDNVYNGTLWDDDVDPGNAAPYVVPSAASKLVTDTQYTNLVAKTTLTPEEALSAFVGEDPNGVWTLTISDDATIDGGTLAAWSLEVTTNTCGTASCTLDCDDGNACTTDSCDPATGCVHVNNAAQCDDENPCTDDSCIPGTGECAHESHSGPCDDGNACTQTDACLAGVCTGSNPVTCTAVDQCHLAGGCDPGTGVCSNPAKPIGTTCDDGNACTVGDSCQIVETSGASFAGLIQLADGALYGTSSNGGSDGFGTVFKLNPDGSGYTVLKNLDSSTTGGDCRGGLLQGTDGAIYGTAAGGGSDGFGTVFKLNPDGTGFTVLKNFDYSTTGGNPQSELVQGTDGILYGTALAGGTNGSGTVFRLNPDGTGFAVLKNFDNTTTGGLLFSGLLQGSDGALYGTAYSGGTFSSGTAFRLNTDGTDFAVIKNFDYFTTGAGPRAALIQGADGTLYGTAAFGGDRLIGTAFRMSTDGTDFTVLRHFEFPSDGGNPQGALILATDGALYGATFQWGDLVGGTVFRLNTDGAGYVVLKTFDNAASGGYSTARLLEGADGALYGTTTDGGTYGHGTVFKLNPDGSGFDVLANASLDPPIVCAGGTNALDCDDDNPCTADACDPSEGCTHTIETGECDDGNPCTTGDVCLEGVCVGEGAVCVIAVDPDNNATNVAVSTNVTLTYHDPIDPATVTSSTFRLTTPGSEGSVPATLTVSSSGTRATLDPTSALSPDTTYRVEATSGIDGPGEESTQPFASFFRTGAITASTAIVTVSEQTDPLPALAKGGSSVAAAGDLNGDGFDDFISGAPGYADAAHGIPVEAGAALVYLGSAGSADRAGPDIIFTGVEEHDRAGVSVAGDFDFNGDGRRDILIGAEQVDRTTTPDSPAATGKGKAYLIFFDPDNCSMNPRHCNPGASNQVSLALVGRGIPGVVFEGVALGDQAGFSVAGGGTSTPSAATDIIIGAPGADPFGVTDAGAAYIVFDNPALSGDVSLALISSGPPNEVPGKLYYGSEPGGHVGFSTAFTGPLVSGQAADRGTVVIGAPDAGSSRGKIIAPPGDPDTTPIIVDAVGRTEPGMTNRPGFQIVGTQPGEQLGFDVADGGDAMEDGVSDLLIGAPTYDVTTAGAGLAILADAGRVLQTSHTFVSGIYDADAVGTSIGGAIWQGAALRDQLGSAVTGVGDVGGDGYPDIVLGAPFVDPIVGGAIQPDAGAVYVINGSPASGPRGLRSVGDVGTTIAGQRLTGTGAGEHAGSSIAGTGDVNGDGRNDFVVGAPDRNNQSGTVYMVLRATGTGAPVGSCGPQGCVVADLPTGAEVDVPAGGLTTTIDITVAGLLDSSALPAPAPAGKVLLGAARFTPNGQPVLSPFATIYIPTTQPLLGSRAAGALLPLSYFNGTGWVNAGIIGTAVANPSYPSRSAVRATADVLRTYAVFVDNCATLNCDDGNPCTNDGCATDTGCFHINNTAPCDDGNLCTTGDTCRAGICTPAFNGINHAAPKSSEYYRQLCERRDRNQLPWHGDQLTVADAVCVGQLTATFSGIATIDTLCGILNSDHRPPHGGRHHGGSGNGPDGKTCDKAENELVATAINICRARVCEEQNLDSHCHGNDSSTVSQSFADADAILDDAARTKNTCKDASCELKEINNGHALELNSLTLTRENTSVRLRWAPPELDDGVGSPDAYEVWRRPMGSGAAFTKIGTTTGLSFLDQTAGTVRWEYQVSSVAP